VAVLVDTVGPGRSRNGDTSRDLKAGENEITDDHRNNHYGNQSDSGNHPSRRALPGAVRRSTGDEYLLESDDFVLAGVCVSLAGLTYKSQTALANMHPLIVRINDVATRSNRLSELSVSPAGSGEQVYLTAGPNYISAAIVSRSSVIKRSRSTSSIATCNAP